VVNEGQVITYTLTFANTAGQAAATVNHTDDLSDVLDDATVTSDPVASDPSLTVSAIAGDAFTITGTVAAGATVTVTFAVTVNTPDTGNHLLVNFVVPTGTTPPPDCPPGTPTCTVHPVPALVVTKSADPASGTTVNEGDVITYTLTFANTAGQAPATVNHTDDLADVLDDAAITTQPVASPGLTVAPVPVTGTSFTITGTVAAGAASTVTFSVTVNTPDTGDHRLDNFVVPTGTTPPTDCPPGTPTCTTHPVPRLVVSKSAVPPSGTTVNEGQVITYTLTFAETAGQAPATVNHTDDLTDVLDDATVTTPPASTGLTVGPITGTSFAITGSVPAGGTATVTFSVTVNTPDTGDHRLDNFVVPTGEDPPPECLPADPACTTHPVPALVVTKTSSPASTTPVAEGQLLTYTLTFSNAAGQAPATVNHTDDLSDVLDDATVTAPPISSDPSLTVSAITGDAFTITGTVAAGATVTVTFSVSVDTPDTGNHVLVNFVVPTGEDPPPECLPTDPTCTTNPVPALVVSKSVVPASGTTVNPGDLLTYTLTFANTAGQAPATVNHTDDLTRVLDDASITTPPTPSAGLTVSPITAGTFTITGTVAAGATETVTFSVTVNTPDTGDHLLVNFVVPTGTNPPDECLPTDPTCTTNPVPALVVSKSSVPPSGTTVNEGQVVTYTLTFANTAGQAPAPVDYTDDLTRVLDDATVTSPATVSSGTGITLSQTSPTAFRITGAIAAGQAATVTLSVRVNTPDTGDHVLDNFLVPTGTTPPDDCVPAAPQTIRMFAPAQTVSDPSMCTTHPVPRPAPRPRPDPPLPATGVNFPVEQTIGVAGMLLFLGTAALVSERRFRFRR
jgi:fimbrial isopeptide formation D2 family protein